MKSRASLFFLVQLLALAAVCQDHPQHPSRPIGLRPDGGTFIAGVYKNGYFGFSFSVGKDWVMNGEELQENRVRLQSRPQSFCLLTAERNAGKSMRESLVLAANNTAGKQPVKAQESVSSMAKALVRLSKAKLIRDAYAVDYGGQRFYRADIKQSYSEGAVYQAYLANEYDGFLFTWEFQADSEERLNQIVSSLNSLSFTHHN